MTQEEDIGAIFARIRKGDTRARDEFFNRNTGLVWACVRKYAGLLEKDDLFQLGAIGLLKAIDRFDPSYGVSFSTYAFPLVVGEIRRYLRDTAPLRVPRRIKEIGLSARKIAEKRKAETGREPPAAEIAEELGVGLDTLLSALDATSPLLYLDEVRAPLETAGSLTREESQESMTEVSDLKEAMASLDDRERFIIEGRFFEGKTQEEISAELGISQAQVCRLQKRALLRLRRFLDPEGERIRG